MMFVRKSSSDNVWLALAEFDETQPPDLAAPEPLEFGEDRLSLRQRHERRIDAALDIVARRARNKLDHEAAATVRFKLLRASLGIRQVGSVVFGIIALCIGFSMSASQLVLRPMQMLEISASNQAEFSAPAQSSLKNANSDGANRIKLNEAAASCYPPMISNMVPSNLPAQAKSETKAKTDASILDLWTTYLDCVATKMKEFTRDGNPTDVTLRDVAK